MSHSLHNETVKHAYELWLFLLLEIWFTDMPLGSQMWSFLNNAINLIKTKQFLHHKQIVNLMPYQLHASGWAQLFKNYFLEVTREGN